MRQNEIDKLKANNRLARGFLQTCVRPLLQKHGATVGLAGTGTIARAEMLVEVGGVTYKLTAAVDHDD